MHGISLRFGAESTTGSNTSQPETGDGSGTLKKTEAPRQNNTNNKSGEPDPGLQFIQDLVPFAMDQYYYQFDKINHQEDQNVLGKVFFTYDDKIFKGFNVLQLLQTALDARSWSAKFKLMGVFVETLKNLLFKTFDYDKTVPDFLGNESQVKEGLEKAFEAFEKRGLITGRQKDKNFLIKTIYRDGHRMTYRGKERLRSPLYERLFARLEHDLDKIGKQLLEPDQETKSSDHPPEKAWDKMGVIPLTMN